MRGNVNQVHKSPQADCKPTPLAAIDAAVYKRGVSGADKPLKTTFIRAWRKHRGLSLVELGERLGVTHALLSRIENGHSPYSQRHLEALAEVLGCTEVDLLTRDPAAPPPIAVADAQELVEAASRFLERAGVVPSGPISVPIARLMVLHVSRRLELHLAPDDPRLEDLAKDLRAFVQRAADPRLHRDLAAAERLLDSLGDAPSSRRA